MSNGREERMVGTIKHAIAKTTLNDRPSWTEALPNVLYGYRRCRMGPHLSPFQLMSGVPPRMARHDASLGLENPFEIEYRELEIIAIQSARAHREHVPRPLPTTRRTLSVGDQVLVAKGRVFSAMKLPAFESKWSGPYEVFGVNHPRYNLRSMTGGVTRHPIHARHLRLWIRRHALGSADDEAHNLGGLASEI